jgi:hypothetical protein
MKRPIFKDLVHTAQETHSLSVIKINNIKFGSEIKRCLF